MSASTLVGTQPSSPNAVKASASTTGTTSEGLASHGGTTSQMASLQLSTAAGSLPGLNANAARVARPSAVSIASHSPISRDLPGPSTSSSISTAHIRTLAEWAATAASEPSSMINDIKDPMLPVAIPAPATQRQPGAAAAGSSRTPRGLPWKTHPTPLSAPYSPPTGVIYPPGSSRNPHFGSMAPQPILDNISKDTLYRPAFLPPGLDRRVDKSAYWIGFEEHGSRPVYFMPPNCERCYRLGQHCNRAWPMCGRCASDATACEPGSSWRQLTFDDLLSPTQPALASQPITRRESNGDTRSPLQLTASTPNTTESTRLTTSQKGKARAEVEPTGKNGLINPPSSDDGRSKRVRKKRRLSASGEIDPNDLNDDGVPVIRPAKRPTTQPSLPRIKKEPNMTADDRSYNLRVDANSRRPALTKMRGPCPVWSDTRSALTAAAEYLRAPIKSVGASVEVGQGGVARGVILEGQAPGQGTVWGQGKEAGTIITSIGQARARVTALTANGVDHASKLSAQGQLPFFTSTSPPINVIPPAARQPGSSVATPSGPVVEDSVESAEVEALLRAQRARTPIALGVADDYSAVPFKVPRKFIVLGWFWIVDAWLEPVVPGYLFYSLAEPIGSTPVERVSWKFRFEWCSPQSLPWWSSTALPARDDHPLLDDTARRIAQQSGWDIDGPGIKGSTTLALPTTGLQATNGAISTAESSSWYHCRLCGMRSRYVYEQGLCLSERCHAFFKTFARTCTFLGPPVNTPGKLQPIYRVPPDILGLRLRPSELSILRPGMGRTNLGEILWRAWVCRDCGKANERKRWIDWECEACHHAVVPASSVIHDARTLRNPARPWWTGPRQEDGFGSFAFPTQKSWSIYKDSIKVVRHGLEGAEGLGPGAELHHALEPATSYSVEATSANKLLERLQTWPVVPFRRNLQPFSSTRASEKYLSPFYTFLAGPEPLQSISHFPTTSSVSWNKVPKAVLDCMDFVNDRAGRMWPGERERFNSLLLAVFPPNLPSSLQPHITVDPGTQMALLFLGSEATIKFKGVGGDSKASSRLSEIAAMHGDVVAFKAGHVPIEIILKLEVFGFVGIVRRVATPDSQSNVVDKGLSDPNEFPAIPAPPRPQPREATAASSASLSRAPALSINTVQGKLLPAASLSGWYIGPRPLDVNDPLRIRAVLANRRDVIRPTFQDEAGDDDKEKEKAIEVAQAKPVEWNGTLEIEYQQPKLDSLAPAPISPMGKKKTAANKGADDSVSGSTAPSKKRAGGKAEGETKKRARKSAVKVETGINPVEQAMDIGHDGEQELDVDMAESVTSVRTSGRGKTRGRGRGGGRGRGRGRGRKSGVASSSVVDTADNSVKGSSPVAGSDIIVAS